MFNAKISNTIGTQRHQRQETIIAKSKRWLVKKLCIFVFQQHALFFVQCQKCQHYMLNSKRMKSQSNFKSTKVFFQNWTKTLRPREWKHRPNQKPCDPTMQSCCMRGRMLSSPHRKPFDPTMQSCCMRDRMLSSPHPKPFDPTMQSCWMRVRMLYHRPTQKPYDTTRQSCCMRERLLSSPHPETLWHDNAVMLHAWQNAIIAPPETIWPNNAVMLHAWPNAIIAPPRNPVTQQGSHVARVRECYHRPTQTPYDTTMQSCCMRDRMLSSPHPKPFDPTMQSCCMRVRMLSSPHPETLWHNHAVMLHAWGNAIIAPPRHPMTRQCSHVACVTECYHRPTRNPENLTKACGLLRAPNLLLLLLLTTYYLLPTTYYLLPTTYYLLPTNY